MRKLSRPAPPPCLSKPKYINWGDEKFQTGCYPAVRATLGAMHGERCAYCESEAGSDAHVEHFVQRSRRPQETFVWSNLFLSCTNADTCGKHKDHKAAPYADEHLLKPDVDDPDAYLRFDENGYISPQTGLSPQDFVRATETIRVFHLDAVGLRRARESAVTGYVSVANDLLDQQPSELPKWVQEEIANTSNQPFATAIRHVLEQLL